MNRIVSFAIRLYKHMLRLFPASYRNKFGEDMLLDFSDLAEDASGKGMLSLLVFLLRELQDFPINLLSVCLKEYPMSTIFGPKLAHNALRGGFALGLAFATVWTTFWLLFSVMQEQGWIFLLRIANSRGWHLTYNAAAQTILYFSSLILGALLGRRITGYVLSGGTSGQTLPACQPSRMGCAICPYPHSWIILER